MIFIDFLYETAIFTTDVENMTDHQICN